LRVNDARSGSLIRFSVAAVNWIGCFGFDSLAIDLDLDDLTPPEQMSLLDDGATMAGVSVGDDDLVATTTARPTALRLDIDRLLLSLEGNIPGSQWRL